MPDQLYERDISQCLDALLKVLPDSGAFAALRDIPRSQAKRIIGKANRIRQILLELVEELDHFKSPENRLDLTNPQVVGAIIGKYLEETRRVPLSQLNQFYGSGVYAIYYVGDAPVYGAISGTECPIYVGSAAPKSKKAETPREQGPSLFIRLSEHTKTIGRASNLSLDDFAFRYLVTQSGWELAAEEYLKHEFHSVWNKETRVCPGFGKHGDTARKEASSWDVLHPGRNWAKAQTSRSGKTAAQITQAIESHFESLVAHDHSKWSKILSREWLRKKKLPS
ncbi:MAG: Eco29kI family restriction endonuclease [Pirellulaceae bacterium]